MLQAGLISVLLLEHRQRQLAEVQSRQRMAELAHVNRFSTAGELTASIAHEINQPLGAILANTETAQAILKSPNPHHRSKRNLGRYSTGRPARHRSDPEDAQPAEKSTV
jgi:C4-dicarboxylate-specific signal transduction histidine kinase